MTAEAPVRIYPFPDPLGELPLLGRSFSERALEEVSLSRAAARLRIGPRDFVPAPQLDAFAEAAGERGARLVLETAWGAVETGVELAPRVDSAVYEPVRLPAGRAHHLQHWFQWLPLALEQVERERGRRRLRRRAGAERPSFIAKGTNVHPRALIDGSIIEPGAVIGDGASIIDSYIGAGVHVSDFARVRRSVLEAETHVMVDARLTEVVALGRGSLANLGLRKCLLGRDVFVTSGVIFDPQPLEGTVRADVGPGASLDTGRGSLGGCVGHGARLGARTLVAPGVVLPCGTTVVMRREEGVQRVEEAPPGTPMVWRDARLVPLEAQPRKANPIEVR